MARVDAALLVQNDGPLNHIAQFADIAGPVVLAQQVQRLRRQFFRLAAIGAGKLFQKIGGQGRNIFTAFA